MFPLFPPCPCRELDSTVAHKLLSAMVFIRLGNIKYGVSLSAYHTGLLELTLQAAQAKH
jgi:hypothetical protein